MYMDLDVGMDVGGSDDTPGASLHVLALWVVEVYVACLPVRTACHLCVCVCTYI